MNGKGDKLRKGSNLDLNRNNYDEIQGFKNNKPKPTSAELPIDAELSSNGTEQSNEDLSVPHPD